MAKLDEIASINEDGWLQRHVPLIRSLRHYTKADFVSDLIAGVTLGLTLIPQSIAYSSLAGIPPQNGLNSAFVGCFVYVVFGSIKEVSIGPTALMSLLTAEYTMHLTTDFVVALCFFVGCVEFFMGIFKLGFLVEFISVPVTSGFQTATSLIIVVSQLPGVLGVSIKSKGLIESLHEIWTCRGHCRVWGDIPLGIGCIIFLLLMRKLKDFPLTEDTALKRALKQILWFTCTARNFLAVLLSASIAYYYESSVGRVPFVLTQGVQPGLPPFRFPNLTPTMGNHTYTVLEVVKELGPGIAITPIVAVLANVAIAKAFASNRSIDATQEMLTLSLCNILGSCVQSMPTCGAFTRSAVASASGVRTPIAGLYCGILTMLALTFLTPYFHFIPKATLSAVLISAVVFLIDYEIVLPLWRTNKWEFWVLLATLVSCVCLGVELGMLFGVLTSSCYLFHLWAKPSIAISARKVFQGQGELEYVMVTPALGMFYPAIALVSSCLVNQAATYSPVVLNCANFISMDITSAKALSNLVKNFNNKGKLLVFLNMSPEMVQLFYEVGCENIRTCRSEVELENMVFGMISPGFQDANILPEDKINKQEIIPLMSQPIRIENKD